MALTRAKKESLVSRYQEELGSTQHAFLVSYQGIDVPQVTELRQKVRESGGSYMVVKNNLALLAIKGSALESLGELFDGPVAVAYSGDDPVALAQALTDFAKEAPMLSFRGGIVDGRPVAAADIEAIAKLPSREELLTQLVFLLQSPITRLARTLNAIPRDFVAVLEQVRQVRQKKEQEG